MLSLKCLVSMNIFMFCTMGMLGQLTYADAAPDDTTADGGAYCKNGIIAEDQVSYLLSTINTLRQLVASGQQSNGWWPWSEPGGVPEENLFLPPAKNMRKMSYDCSLEQEAKNILAKMVCGKDIPEDQEPTRGFVFNGSNNDEFLVGIYGQLIRIFEFPLTSNQPMRYIEVDGETKGYVNMIRGSASKVGCANSTCREESSGKTLNMALCITDKDNIQYGDEIYELREGEECECDKPWTCSDDSLCVAPVKFPESSDEEPSTKCSSKEISDTMRMHMQDTHNYRRSQLALGQISDNKGKPLPAASNMNYLVWDCALEREAHDFLRDCPKEGYERPNDDSLAQNFYYGTTDEPTYRDMNKKAVTEWWKQVRKVAGPGTKAFTTKHNNTEIKSFTLMGWASSREMGCSIAKCGSYWVEACRYYPPGNKVGQSMYKSGKVCSKCDASGAKSCDKSLGLCGSEK